MIVAVIQQVLSVAAGIGVVCAALVGLAAVARIPVVSRPLRWIGRTLVGDPVTRAMGDALDRSALGQRVERVESQLQRNGGSSVRDAIDRLEDGQARIEGRLSAGDAAIAQLRHGHAEILRVLAPVEDTDAET